MMSRIIKGFSALELLIALSIMALVMVLAISSFANRFQKESIETITQQIFHSLHFARMEAIKRNQVISLCGTRDFQTCSLDWTQGFMVYIDVNRDGKFSSEDVILRMNKHKSSTVCVDSGQIISFKYAPNGRCITRGTITIHNSDISPYKIVVYDSGRARIEQV